MNSNYTFNHTSISAVVLPRARGFTLMELLVAVAVFAVMSAMAYGGLNTVMKARSGMVEHSDRLVSLQKTFTIMGRDIEQTIARDIRDQYGDSKDMLRSQTYEDIKLELTHGGWRNPFPSEKRVRSTLQRTGYKFTEGKLIRLYWYDLDRGYESKPLESVLLENVKSFELRFVDEKKQWQTSWPKLNSKEPMPIGVEVTVELEGLGKVVRLFRVPARVVQAQQTTQTP